MRVPYPYPTDAYASLGVSHSAPQKEIRVAWYTMSRCYHPDHAAPDQQVAATERAKELNAAYEDIGDADARAKYDNHLRATAIRAQQQARQANCSFTRPQSAANESHGGFGSSAGHQRSSIFQPSFEGQQPCHSARQQRQRTEAWYEGRRRRNRARRARQYQQREEENRRARAAQRAATVAAQEAAKRELKQAAREIWEALKRAKLEAAERAKAAAATRAAAQAAAEARQEAARKDAASQARAFPISYSFVRRESLAAEPRPGPRTIGQTTNTESNASAAQDGSTASDTMGDYSGTDGQVETLQVKEPQPTTASRPELTIEPVVIAADFEEGLANARQLLVAMFQTVRDASKLVDDLPEGTAYEMCKRGR